MMKVLNLYAGIGGNRKLWENVNVTAVEIDYKIAEIYQHNFPNDEVIVDEAHNFLESSIDDGWDFIWSSPPCPTHSKIRNVAGVGCGQNKPVYPDMSLYQEIIFLNQAYHTSGSEFRGKWCVENVIGYYDPLIRPQRLGNHYFWANFEIGKLPDKSRAHMEGVESLQKRKGFDLSKYKGVDKVKLLRNCTEPELGLHIFKSAFKLKQQKLTEDEP